MDLRLLGPAEFVVRGNRFGVGPARQRTVLAALAVDVGRPVSTETLIDRVWDRPPATVRNVVHTYVARLRRVVADVGGSVALGPGGYSLLFDPDRVDVIRFRRLLGAAAEESRGPAERATLLHTALALWRGEPLAGCAGTWAARLRDELEERRLTALMSLAPIDVELGRSVADVVAELRTASARHPLVEPLAALIMRLLCRDGRYADALAHYASIGRRLRDELGTGPGRELQDTHRAVLRGEMPGPSTVERAGPHGCCRCGAGAAVAERPAGPRR